MAELLKNYYSKTLISSIASNIKNVHSNFDADSFVGTTFTKDFESLELKDRMRFIVEKLNENLSFDFEHQIQIISKIVDQYSGLQGMIFPDFVQRYGIENYKTSINALKHFTTYSTSEFAIRPFIEKYPETIHEMQAWVHDKNFHVRRLASEGCRPMLPWAPKLTAFVADPTPILPILEALKEDDEDYVYRSVANNLNDISKNQPELAIEIARQWSKLNRSAKWAAKHGLRTLLKSGHQEAMTIFGFGKVNALEIQQFVIEDSKINIGGKSRLNGILMNKGGKSKFRIEYSIHYLKKNKKYSEKVFQISELELAKNESVVINKTVNFKDLTTRKHYIGNHFAQLIVNGNRLNKIEFEIV